MTRLAVIALLAMTACGLSGTAVTQEFRGGDGPVPPGDGGPMPNPPSMTISDDAGETIEVEPFNWAQRASSGSGMRSPRDQSLVATGLAVVIEPPYPNVAAFLTPSGAGEAVALIPTKLENGTFRFELPEAGEWTVDLISMVDDFYAVYSFVIDAAA